MARNGGSEAAEAVLAANRAFYDAFNAKDLGQMAETWARDAEVTCIHPHRAVIAGRAAVLDSWRQILTNPDQGRIVFAAERPIISGRIGVVCGRELVAGIPIAATNVFAEEDGRWRMIHHHGSPVLHASGSGD